MRVVATRDARVIAVQIERLGDLLVSTPALRRLRASLPQAHITLVCAPATAGVLRGWDAIDDITVFDPRAGEAERKARIAEIRSGGIDLSVTLTSSRPAYALARRLGGTRRAGVVYSDNLIEGALAGLFFTHPVRVWVGARPPAHVRVLHRAEELLRINAALGLDATPTALELPLGPEHHAHAVACLSPLGAAGLAPLVLHLARGGDDPRDHGRWVGDGWSDDDLLDVVARLRASVAPAALVLTAGPEDRATAAAVERAYPRARTGDDGLLLVTNVDVHTWAAVLARAAVVVAPDTAAIHVAAAVGRPVVAVYAPGRFAVTSRQWAPFMVPHRAIAKGRPRETIARVVDAVADLCAHAGPASAHGTRP